MGNSSTHYKDYNYGTLESINDDNCIKRFNSNQVHLPCLISRIKTSSIKPLHIHHLDGPLCGSKQSINVTFKYYSLTLYDDVISSKKNETYLLKLSETLLTKDFDQMTYLHPKQILLPDFLVCNPEIFQSLSHEEYIEKLEQENYYFTPEIFYHKPNIEKAQVFNIGMILLFAMTGQQPGDQQIYQDKLIQWDKLENWISSITQFTKQFITLLQLLVQENPKDRPTKQQALDKIKEVWEFQNVRTLKLNKIKKQELVVAQIQEEIITQRRSELSYNYQSQTKRKLTEITNSQYNIKSACPSPNGKSIQLSFSHRSHNIYSFSTPKRQNIQQKQKYGRKESKSRLRQIQKDLSKSKDKSKLKCRWK